MESRSSRDLTTIVRSKGQQHGAILTGGLPVGFLTVWAVVYVDVWGLLLFYSNTAEMEASMRPLILSAGLAVHVSVQSQQMIWEPFQPASSLPRG